jgi:ribosome modulation factor
MTCVHRTWVDLDHAKAAGYEAYFLGLTPADVPHDEYSGHIRDWWLSGWRQARRHDQPLRGSADAQAAASRSSRTRFASGPPR